MKSSLFTIFLLLPQLSAAMPSLTNSCGERGISFTPPDNTSLVAFNENCDTAFIGPPANGKVSVDQVMGSMNLLFCETVKILPKTVEAARKGMQFWADRLAKKSLEYDALAETVNIHAEKLAQLKPLLDSNVKILQKHKRDVGDALKIAIELRNRYEVCKLGVQDPSECNPVHIELKNALRLFSDYKALESQAELVVIDLEYETEKETNKLNEIEERMERLTVDLEKFKKLLTGLENDALEGYQRYGQLHGATAIINFSSDWQALIRQAQRNNYLHVEQMPLVGTTVAISSSMPGGFGIKSMSTLLGARVPGFDTYTANREPQKIDLSSQMSLNPMVSATNISGQLDFSLLGACPMTDENGEINLVKAQKAMIAELTVNLQHTYPMMMRRSYEINFNTKKIASEMERLAESGGFLSSSKIYELVKYNLNSDVFDINFYSQGGHTDYTEEEKQIIKEDAKYEIADKVLTGMNAIPQYSSERPPPPRLDRSSGARFIYANMPCFGYAICYATGFIIGVADAIFGSKESVSKFTKINEINIKYRYENKSPGYRIINAIFSGRGQ